MKSFKERCKLISIHLNLGTIHSCSQYDCDDEHLHPYESLYNHDAFTELFESILDNHYIYIAPRKSTAGDKTLLIRLDDNDYTDSYNSDFKTAFINSVYKLFFKED